MRSVGKQKEFLSAYNMYTGAIYRHCFFRVYSKALAEDLVQETFMRTWRYIQEGGEIENIRAFLYRVCHNLIVDTIRRRVVRKEKEGRLDAFMENFDFPEPSYDGREIVEDQILAKETIEVILTKLPEDYRKVLIMRYLEELSPKEIAQILGTAPNNVSTKINHAKKVLKNLLSTQPH